MSFIIGPLQSFFSKLQFPTLFGIAVTLFILDFFLPDLIPFADEIILALSAALLGIWKKRKKTKSTHDAADR
jgi:hypothetical protein